MSTWGAEALARASGSTPVATRPDEPVEQPIDELVDQLVDEPVEELVDEPVDDSSRPLSHSAERAVRLDTGLVLVGLHLLLAVGAMQIAAIVAGCLLIMGVGLAVASRHDTMRQAGTGVAAVSMAVLASVTAPIADPLHRLGLVAVVLAPFALAGGSQGASWWRLPDRPVRSLVGAVLAGSGFAAIMSLTPLPDALAPMLEGASAAEVALGVAIVVAAATIYEAVYRGALLDALGGGWIAVGVSAFVGAIVLVETGSVGLTVTVFGAGVLWGAMRRWSGSVWVPAVSHATVHVLLQLYGR